MAGISVGSVSVDIVPDTTNFRRELNAKLKDLTVPVRLNLNDKAFKTELDAATRDRTVNVRVDDKGSIKKTQGQTIGLVQALALLAPAAAPLTAVAAGGAVALTGLGAAGFLAFKGIKEQMAQGTPVGVRYSSMVAGLSKDYQSLEKVAARGVLKGVDDAIGAVNGQMPTLRREVDLLSRSLGSDLEPLTRGLLAIFQDLFPTTQSIAGGIHSLAVDFETWATGPGGRSFAAYLAQELPIVASTLQSLATAGAHVVQALLPLGGPVLQAIKGISDGISSLPVYVIKDLYLAFLGYKVVTLAAAAGAGFKAVLQGIGDAAVATEAKLTGVAAAEVRASRGGIAGAASKGGGLGLIGGGLGLVGGAAAALIGESIIAKQDNQARAKAAVDALHDPAKLAAAQQRLQDLLSQQRKLQVQGAPGQKGFLGNTTNALQVSSQQQQAAIGSQIAALKAQITASGGATVAQAGLSDSVRIATDRIKAQTAATAAWSNAMVGTSNLTQDLINGNIGYHQALADANAALKANGRTLDLNTQKGRDNQTVLLRLAVAARTKIQTDIDGHRSQGKINADWVTGHRQLEIMAQKFGLSAAAAKRYADRLLGIKPLIKTTVIINTAAAQAKVDALKSGLSAIQFYANQKNSGPTPGATPGRGGTGPNRAPGATGGLFIRRSFGGPVWGAGSATSDSIPALLSNGEFVIKAATVKTIGAPYLHKMNDTGMTPASGVQVVQNITTQPGQDNVAIAQIAGSQLAIVLHR